MTEIPDDATDWSVSFDDMDGGDWESVMGGPEDGFYEGLGTMDDDDDGDLTCTFGMDVDLSDALAGAVGQL